MFKRIIARFKLNSKRRQAVRDYWRAHYADLARLNRELAR